MSERGPEEVRDAVDAALAQEEAREALDGAVEQARRHLVPVLAGLSVTGILGGFLRRRTRRALGGARRRRRILRRFGLGVLIVVSSVATCSFGVDPSTLTASYGDPVPSSTQDAARVLARGAEALQTAPESGRVRVTLTEEEATSALSLGLMLPELMMVAERIPPEEIHEAPDLEALRERVWREADLQREVMAADQGFARRMLIKLDPKIRTGDIQVRFEASGEVVLAGYVQAWAFRQPGIFVVAPEARDGELALDFVSGRLGRVPLPELVFDWLGGLMASAVLFGREHAEISELSVGDGTLTFEGRVVEGAQAH